MNDVGYLWDGSGMRVGKVFGVRGSARSNYIHRCGQFAGVGKGVCKIEEMDDEDENE